MSLIDHWEKQIESIGVNERKYISSQVNTIGVGVVRDFCNDALLYEARQIWRKVEPLVVRRDVTIKHEVTSKRIMGTASALQIDNMTREIFELYTLDVFVQFMAEITGTDICLLNDNLERYVFNFLSHKGDMHGLHVDSFSYSCSLVIYAPSTNSGGVLQVAKNYTCFDKDKVASIIAEPGDLIVLSSSKFPHRVSPLKQNSQRVVLNMAFTTEATKNHLSYSRESLYS